MEKLHHVVTRDRATTEAAVFKVRQSKRWRQRKSEESAKVVKNRCKYKRKCRFALCLRRYWQGGQMKNALLPDFNRCSTQGKKRKSIDRHAPKQGRPSRVARLTGVSTGMNIDDTVKEYFRRGTKLFYENAEKMPMTQAFERILILFFHQGKELQNGVFVPMLPLNCLHSISIDAGTQRNMTPDIPSLHAKT